MGEDFVKVAETKDIQASQMMVVEVNGEKCASPMLKENTMQ